MAVILGNVATDTRKVDTTTYRMLYSYDRQGNVTRMTYPDSSVLSYAYNGLGKVEGAAYQYQGVGSFAPIIRATDYSPLEQVTSRAFGNYATTTWTYDPNALYRLTSIKTATSTQTTAVGNTYALDLELSSSQYARISDASQTGLDLAGTTTIEGWFNFESLPASGNFETLVAKMIDAGSPSWNHAKGYDLIEENIAGTQTLEFGVFGGTTLTYAGVAFTPTAETWYHVAVTYNPSGSNNVKFYINGVQQGTTQTLAETSINNADSNFVIGAMDLAAGGEGYFFDGQIDDVRVWNTERSLSQISTNKSTELTGSESGLVAYYKLNNSYSDSTSNANNLTAGNSPVFTTSVPFGSVVDTTNYLQNITYTYDLDNNITQILDTSATAALKTINFTYDNLNRLLSASTTAASSNPFIQYYGYNELGNLTNFSTTTATTGGVNSNYLDLELNSSQSAYISDASQTNLDPAGNITLEGWFNFESLPASGNLSTLMGKMVDAGSSAWNHAKSFDFTLENVAGTQKLGFGAFDGTTVTYAYMPFTPTVGTWYHFAVTYNTSGTNNVKFYVNGVQQGATQSLAVTSLNNADSNFVIGAMDLSTGGEGYFFDGQLDDIRVFGRELTSTEISSDMSKQLTGSESNLLAYYKLNNSYADASSNGNTLTASNSPVFANSSMPFAGGNGVDMYQYAGTGYANPHAPTSIGSSTLAYDNNGNLLTYKATGSATSTYAYDYANRIIQSIIAGATTNYSYDHIGQRMKQWFSTGSTTYPFKYFDIASTTSTSVATTTSYIYIGDTLVATIQKAGTATTTRYIHPDHLGSTNVMSDPQGNISSVMDYFPFGATRVSTGSSTATKQFIGQYADTSGLSYLNARYFSATQGQFLSEDPIFWSRQNLADPQSLNSYSYANGNPIIGKDPSGLLSNKSSVNITRNLIADLFSFANNLAAYANGVAHNPVQSFQSARQTVNSIGSDPARFARSAASRVAQNASQTWKDINSGNDTDQERGITNWIEFSGSLMAAGGGTATADAVDTLLPHANSLLFPGENYGYQLAKRDTGTVVKFGETTNPRTRYSDQYLNSNNLQLNVLVYGSKETVHDWQHQMILNTRDAGGSLPFNKSNW